MAKSMAKEDMIGRMDHIMMENGKTIKSMDLELINGLMEENIQESG